MKKVKRSRESVLCFFFFLTVLFCSFTYPQHAIVGLYVKNMETGEVIVENLSQTSFIPGSCLKLVTTAAILEELGPKYSFSSLLGYKGEIKSSILAGNIHVKGSGDPSFASGRGNSLCWKKQIEVLADAIQKQGIQQIQGAIFAEEDMWDGSQLSANWLWEDLGNYYGSFPSSLNFNENMCRLSFAITAPLFSPTKLLHVDPPLTFIDFFNQVGAGPVGSGDQACIYGMPGMGSYFIKGTLPIQEGPFTIKGSLPYPGKTCAALLEKELKERGVTVEGQHLQKSGTVKPIEEYTSPPLSELLYWTNHKSINLYADAFFYKLGEKEKKKKGSIGIQDGQLAIKKFLNKCSVEDQAVHIVDGSGLSRKNLLSPRALLQVLEYMHKSPHYTHFLESLPSLASFPGIKAKTGFMSGVKCYAGYKGPYSFVLFMNNITDKKEAQNFAETFFHFLTSLSLESKK